MPGRPLLGRRKLRVRDHDEVDVAVLVRVPDRERPLQVCTDEVAAERRSSARHEFVQDAVQVREARRVRAGHLQRTRMRCPTTSAFELASGFSACSASTVVPNFAATVPNVSPDSIT